MGKNIGLNLTMLAAMLLRLLGLPGLAAAQYVISARAGLVNYTTGPVSYSSRDDSAWTEVTGHLQLNEGDRLKTEAWGKAEILLAPGSFLRIANGAQVRLLSSALEATVVELLSGSAIVEAGHVAEGATITVQTPYSRVLINKAGLYRIDLVSDAMTLTVRSGAAYFSQPDGSLKKVKKNRTVLVTESSYQIAKFNQDAMDEFDLWSADRAELLLAANHSFLRRAQSWTWPRLAWNAWVYDPFFGCYTFFPWGIGFWSPYGYGYYWPWYPGGSWAGGGQMPSQPPSPPPYDRPASEQSDTPLLGGNASKPEFTKTRQIRVIGRIPGDMGGGTRPGPHVTGYKSPMVSRGGSWGSTSAGGSLGVSGRNSDGRARTPAGGGKVRSISRQ